VHNLALAHVEPAPLPARPRPRPAPSSPPPAGPCSATVARQFSLWPFGTRTLRLFLLLDPSRTAPDLQRGVLRAMQEAFGRAECGSQTSAVRRAALAAHYVLRHHNQDVLPSGHVTASAAVAATRGRTAYVALIGDAAAFAVREGVLSGQSSSARMSRPLGLDSDPRVTLWSTPLEAGDRLVLVCGGPAHAPLAEAVADTLATCAPEEAEARLAEALEDPAKPVRVLVAEPGRPLRPERHLQIVPNPPPNYAAGGPPRAAVPWHPRHWLASLAPLAVLCLAALPVLTPTGGAPPHAGLAQQVQDLLVQADATTDVHAAHALASSALDLAARASASAPTEYAPLVDQVTRKLEAVDRAEPVAPSVAVRLGPGGANVVDLSVGPDALYTLDPVEASVRAFRTDTLDQTPTPETLLLRAGTPVGGSHRLATPVAITYLDGPGGAPGSLTVVDDARAVVQVAHDGSASVRTLPSAAAWQQLAALGADADGTLYVLDTGAGHLLGYPGAIQQVADPPRLLFDGLPLLDPQVLGRAVEVLPLHDVYLRLDDGRVRRLDRTGAALDFQVQLPDGPLGAVAALADDRGGGLYLADPTHARIIQTTSDGTFVRQLRDPALAGVRQLHTSPDGQRLYGLIPSGVLAIDVPSP